MYMFFKLLWTFGLVLGVWTQPIRLQTAETQSYEEWPLTSDFVVRDTLQGYYENVVDDVIGGYNEQLLIGLVHSMNTQALKTTIQRQATLLGLHHASDACLVKMPGIIARHVNRIHHLVLAAIDPAIEHYLPKLSPTDTTTEELESAFASLNQAMGDHFIRKMEYYNLRGQVVQDMEQCEEEYDVEEDLVDPEPSSSMAEMWSWLSHRLPAMIFGQKQPEPPMSNNPLLEDYLETVRSQLWVELDDRIPDLVTTIQTDILDQDDF
ncbi:hypothetical protein EC973_000539 [Apophysomyces ossiformis]|uniref:Uncharacterized protein n=1 Tax=Apophysomyces ossiformis TaxID=679940 RepID=A0A8H7BKR7_9FUNG|nr:hypothetical protein EC973_000539 [Apophysomyces ossiformis]